MKYLMLVIPADEWQPVRVIESSDDPLALRELVFGKDSDRAEVTFSSFRHHHLQVCYDDLGLYREDGVRNTRAAKLWAWLAGRPELETPQLIGNFVFLGLNPHDGETKSVPFSVVEAADELFGSVPWETPVTTGPGSCPVLGCQGDARYAPPGRGHRDGCTYLSAKTTTATDEEELQ